MRSKGGNVGEYSVAEISRLVKKSVEEKFSYLRVTGEISSAKRAPSGHIYFSLKEGNDTLNAIMWSSTARRNPHVAEIVLQEGSKACITGKLTTYSGTSRYQLIAQDAVLTGKGAILAEIEERRARLQAEGVFSLQEGNQIPYVPRLIGVVTSPTGSVIRDILHRVRDRYPVPVLVWPAAVQGENCPTEIIRGIQGFNRLSETRPEEKPDLIIVARGGGSFEDLLGFNDENVVRAVASSTIPVISAIGHETDRTLIDLAATRAAPTPTAAAEVALPVRNQLSERIGELGRNITVTLHRENVTRRQRIVDLGKRLPRHDTVNAGRVQYLDIMTDRMPRALAASVVRRRDELGFLGQRIDRHVILGAIRTRLDWMCDQLYPDLVRRSLVKLGDDNDSSWRKLNDLMAKNMSGRKTVLRGINRLLASLSYRTTLERGYAVVRENGKIIDSRNKVQDASRLEIEFHDGRVSLSGRTR